MIQNELPGKPSPYKIEAGEGQRFAFGKQLATVLARPEEIGASMHGAVLSGAKGERFPMHRHAAAYEAIYVLEGNVSFTLGEQSFLLTPGDYVNIPPGTAHGFTYLDHRGKLVSWTFGSSAGALYAALGQPYKGVRYSESLAPIDWGKTIDGVDTEWLTVAHASAPAGEKVSMMPGGAVPFVLASGEGDRMIAAEQLYTVMGTEDNSKGLFTCLMNEGAVGPRIPKHMHEKVAETFFVIDGELEMLIGDEAITLAPGDFAFVPTHTPHAFQLKKNSTRFIGFLTPGYFEHFFRYLCTTYDGYVYPLDPPPFRFDRVIQHLSELDLKILERPGGPPPPAPAA